MGFDPTQHRVAYSEDGRKVFVLFAKPGHLDSYMGQLVSDGEGGWKAYKVTGEGELSSRATGTYDSPAEGYDALVGALKRTKYGKEILGG